MKESTLYAEIKANQKKLDNCTKHKFELGEPPYKFGMKLTCLNCGGQLQGACVLYYCEGYKAAGGNPNDIIKGYF